MIKQFFFKQLNLALVNKIKWFQVLLYITNNSIKYQSFVSTQLNDQTVQFLTIQFSISHLFALSLNVKQFYLTQIGLSGPTTPGQSAPGSNSNEEVLCIPQSSIITRPSPSYSLVSYPGLSLGMVGSYSFAGLQSGWACSSRYDIEFHPVIRL